MKIVILLLFFTSSMNLHAKVVPFNMGKKFLILIQDNFTDSDASDLYDELDIQAENIGNNTEKKLYSLTIKKKRVIDIACTKFLDSNQALCNLALYKSKYRSVDLSKKRVSFIAKDSYANKLISLFKSSGLLYQDISRSLVIKNINSGEFRLSLKF